MISGTILFDPKFKFKDGHYGEKLFVVLNEGNCGHYICVKTTSNGNRYCLTCGCQSHERFPCYYCPKGSCLLIDHTWIQLEEYYEFEKASLIQKVITNVIKRIGVLPNEIATSLLNCALQSEDITQLQETELNATLSI